ncbi:HAD-IC family P-type ATPase [Streptomyces sp. AM 3-1-1]|uniref:HAD-IC family P-type ATPase n=1 Tax=Streptomyces sp. AM 3-1-1 TaxID=3028711 RepID=UPI0023B951B7|nr:HAD-IC family P-type ATPase [Streptomyces sp. AM 3-1-1]WEH26168.1 HAD-IC family P-type ATPase [Streptomyces sp. AM 3-1-1]
MPETAAPLHVLRRLESSPRGLTEEQAALRAARYGPNLPPAPVLTPWWRLARRGLADPFTAVLLALSPVSALVSAWGTAAVTALLVGLSLLLRALGQRRAERASAALGALLGDTAAVRRRARPDAEPRVRDVPVAELVPGDVVLLGPGDRVPADLWLLRTRGLRLRQAALSGESDAVARRAGDPGGALLGSTVASGTATGLVTATGTRTRLLGAWDGPPRPASAFAASVRGVAWTLVRFMLLVPPLVLCADALAQGQGAQTLPFAVAVAVGLTPEMLPVVATLAPARAALRLAAEHGVIVNRPSALHDLGAVEVLCVDKTGTLTADEPRAHASLDARGAPDPEPLRLAAVAAAWTLELGEVPRPAPLDEALLAAADAAGIDPLGPEGLAALPFDAERRRASVLLAESGGPGAHVLVVKGAVDAVLERCACGPGERARAEALAGRLAADGLRVLAVATARRAARPGRGYTPADERGLALVGFVTFRDPPVAGVAGALSELTGLGVEVRVLTGDQPGTAARACRELGLDPGEVVDMRALAALPEAERAVRAARGRVFARCAPEDKAWLVARTRAAGRVTGFLGDGWNDVPALRAADVGLCPPGAVALAREHADLVLGGKDLGAAAHAVRAGRSGTATVLAYLRAALSSNLGNVVAMLVAGLLLPFLPMLPAQVLVQNLCFDLAQTAYVRRGAAARPSARPVPLRTRALVRQILGYGALNAGVDVLTFAALAWGAGGAAGTRWQALFHAGWFTENLLTQALVLVVLRPGAGRVPKVLWAAVAGLVAVGVALPPSPVGAALGMVALPWRVWAALALLMLAYGGALRWIRGRGRPGWEPAAPAFGPARAGRGRAQP